MLMALECESQLLMGMSSFEDLLASRWGQG